MIACAIFYPETMPERYYIIELPATVHFGVVAKSPEEAVNYVDDLLAYADDQELIGMVCEGELTMGIDFKRERVTKRDIKHVDKVF